MEYKSTQNAVPARKSIRERGLFASKPARNIQALSAAVLAGCVFGCPAAFSDENYATLNDAVKDATTPRTYIVGAEETLEANLDAAASGVLNIIGAQTGDLSTIDANGHSVFNLSNATELTLKDLEIKNANTTGLGGALSVTSKDATVNIENVTFNNNSGNRGGAIYNTKTIGDIVNSVFSGNHATATSGNAFGGAIFNYANVADYTVKIGNITADFTGNYAESESESESGQAFVGAIANFAYNGSTEIGNITGNFTNNHVKDNSSTLSKGGAIMVYTDNLGKSAKIGDITGNFIDNYVETESGNTDGGAISISSHSGIVEIGNITGDFKNNHVKNNNGLYAVGGAIYNSAQTVGTFAQIGNINSNFIGNYAESETGNTDGGAIYNYAASNIAEIGNITGNFINNHVKNTRGKHAYSGAIYNIGENTVGEALIGNIRGNFISNYAQCDNGESVGGAIGNMFGTINSISGYFEGNYALSGGRASAGAISNNNAATITEGITANFKDNYAKTTGTGALARGGAVLNFGYIKHLTGSFDGNYAESAGSGAIGGALANIYGNEGSLGIDKLSGIYTNNRAVATGSGYAQGGAIYNTGVLGDIVDSAFSGNYVTAVSGNARGGAIYNTKTMGNITANFADNYATSTSAQVHGGAIYNSDTIGSITGLYSGNHILSEKERASGGAIYNSGSITALNADFQANSASADTMYQKYVSAYGGAVLNSGKIDSIQGNYQNNFVYSKNGVAYGGAIATLEDSTIGTINANFDGNYALAESGYDDQNWISYGGAMVNKGSVDTINGIFKNNYVKATDTCSAGALGNWAGSINTISGAFINNHALATETSAAGGAIDTDGTITTINADFIENYAQGSLQAQGGALNLDGGKINNITGTFSKNRAIGGSGTTVGGAIVVNRGSIENLNADFYQNSVQANSGNTYGGAISVGRVSGIDNIKGNFVNNSATSKTKNAAGGAIYNLGSIGDITANYIKNHIKAGAAARGGAIYNSGSIANINGEFYQNTATAESYVQGGSLYNTGTVGNIIGNFGNNTTTAGTYARGGAIYNTGTTGNITGDFGNNTISAGTYALGGTIFNAGTTGNITGDFGNNTISAGTYALGGAIYNAGTTGVIDGSFINNSVKTSSETELALGGAVFSDNTDLQFSADNKINTFSGNFSQDYRGKLHNAIFVRTNKINSSTGEETFYNPTITLKATNNGSFIFDDTIDGGEINSDWSDLKHEHQYNLTLKGDSTGKINLNNSVFNANIEHNDVTTTVNGLAYLSNNHNSLTMNSGTLNLGSLGLSPLRFENFAMNGGTINISGTDVDLANRVMGRISANTYENSAGQGSVNVLSMNVLNDGKELVTPVPFADKSFKNTVKSDVTEAYTPLYRYDVSYDTSGKYGEDGFFVFSRGGADGSGGSAFNPAVLATPVANNAAAQATINETFHYVFEHADAFTQFPQMERISKIESNKYAISTDFNQNLGSFNYEESNKGVWVRPYSTFESINLKHGPKVDAINYGSLIGYDGDFVEAKNGWHRLGTSYVGYNGARLDYNGVDTNLNGGILGGTETFYKGNFWSAITLAAGASVGENQTMYGSENFTSLMTGIGSKTGYNFEFKEGKFIVQPIMFMSYTFINTFDYTNAAGVSINSDPAHSFQLNPSVRFIGNLKNGWQPYASVGMVWNVLNQNSATANNVKLPEMGIKPYVEYGVGVQRQWKENFTAFGQAMMRNGGRNGIALTAGFRWSIGKKANDTKNVNNFQPENKTVIKQIKHPTSISLSSAKH